MRLPARRIGVALVLIFATTALGCGPSAEERAEQAQAAAAQAQASAARAQTAARLAQEEALDAQRRADKAAQEFKAAAAEFNDVADKLEARQRRQEQGADYPERDEK
jgi:hypothetical protein